MFGPIGEGWGVPHGRGRDVGVRQCVRVLGDYSKCVFKGFRRNSGSNLFFTGQFFFLRKVFGESFP